MSTEIFVEGSSFDTGRRRQPEEDATMQAPASTTNKAVAVGTRRPPREEERVMTTPMASGPAFRVGKI